MDVFLLNHSIAFLPVRPPQFGTRVSLEPCYEVIGGTSEQDPLVVTRKDA
jgi:hypothetical protein